MNLQQTAFAIYKLMKSFSILKITNCMTRLRLQLKTEDIANLPLKELKNIPNVLGVNLNDNELQIILGPGKVNEVTSEFKKLYANKNLETNAQNTRKAYGKTGYLGVSEAICGGYRARIKVGDKTVHLGIHETPKIAHQAYLEAKRKYHEGNTL